MKQRRFERQSDELVTSVLLGAPPRELPAGVVAQLDALTAARTRPRIAPS
jgi:cell shape-determining protein MreC